MPKNLRWLLSDLGLLWACVLLYALPVFWPRFSAAPLPLAGARELLDPWIGIPVWLALVIWTLMASWKSRRSAAAMYAGAGFLGATALALSFYVANSAFLGLFVCCGALIRLGRKPGGQGHLSPMTASRG